jgi:hypothetical protein
MAKLITKNGIIVFPEDVEICGGKKTSIIHPLTEARPAPRTTKDAGEQRLIGESDLRKEHLGTMLSCIQSACIYMQGCQSDKKTIIEYAEAFFEAVQRKVER